MRWFKVLLPALASSTFCLVAFAEEKAAPALQGGQERGNGICHRRSSGFCCCRDTGSRGSELYPLAMCRR